MKTVDEIHMEMRQNFEEKAGFEINDGCDMDVRLGAAAAQIYSLYVYNEWLQKQCFPQTATGSYLDNHAEMRGIKRIPAASAEGKIRFLLNDVRAENITIKAGTVCMNAGGERFITTEDTVISAGDKYCDAPAKAAEAGETGNVSSGTIVYMTVPPIGVSACSNTDRFTGGSDEETDESLRARVLHSFSKLPNGANAAFYEKEVLEYEGVAAVKVLPKARGIGTVDIIVSAADGLPDSDMLAGIKAELDKKREICVDLKVKAPTEKKLDLTAALAIEDGYEFSEVKANVKAAVEKYFDGHLLGEDVIRVKLGEIIFHVPGVKNYKITGPEADVTTDRDELPVINTLEINTWG